MTIAYQRLETRPQPPRADAPYDTWRDPGGATAAQFYRESDGFLVRFPGEADFAIDGETLAVQCHPAPGDSDTSDKLFHNSIVPLLANHRGCLALHGSAVLVGGRAVGFLGPSRRGKTTLAGAFARAGFPYLTEDVLGLQPTPDGYLVQPDRPELRLFRDSAAYLLGPAAPELEADDKSSLRPSSRLPFSGHPAPLASLFVLGPGTAPEVRIDPLGPAEALAELIQNAFVLDVEDRLRLRAHFSRIGTLSESVSCYRLDYPRRYEQLGMVINTVTKLSDDTRQ